VTYSWSLVNIVVHLYVCPLNVNFEYEFISF